MNFSGEEQKNNNSFAAKPNKGMFNSLNVVGENLAKVSEQDKYQKKIFKMDQHHKQYVYFLVFIL